MSDDDTDPSAPASPANVLLREGAPLANKMLGGAVGALLGTFVAGPPGAALGAALGPAVEMGFNKAVAEFAAQRLGGRQRIRAGAGLQLFSLALERRFQDGERLRQDGFFDADQTGRRPLDEILEEAIQAAISSTEEKRLPWLMQLHASICFDETISRSSAMALFGIANSMSFRRMCMLKIVDTGRLYSGAARATGPQPAWSELDHIVARDADGLVSDGILILRKSDQDNHDSNLAYLDIEPGMLQLGRIGQSFVDRMRLGELADDEEEMIEAELALKRIANSTSPGIVFDAGTFD